MFGSLFSWGSMDLLDEFQLTFYDCVLKVSLETVPSGTRVSFICIDMERGKMRLENVNEELEDDDPLVLGEWDLFLRLNPVLV